MPTLRPGSADGPEQVGVLVRVGVHHRSVGQHHLRAPQMVDGQSALAGQPPHAAGGGQPADADTAVVAGTQRPAVRFERLRHLHPAGARADPDPPGRLVEHLDPVHPTQVDDDAAVVGGPAADPVPAAAHTQRDPLGACESHRLSDLVGGTHPQHESGRAAAQVGGTHPAVPGVARFDGVLRQRRRQRVVVDPVATFGAYRRAADPRLGRAVATSGGDGLPHRWDHLLGERLQRGRVVAGRDERGDAVLDGEPGDLLDPVRRRPLEPAGRGRLEAPEQVQHPADLPRITTRLLRRCVDHLVAAGQVARLQVGQRRQPAVGTAADQPLHPRLERAEPDLHGMGRRRAALGTVNGVELTQHVQRPPFVGVPDAADDLQRLVQRLHGLTRFEPFAAHRTDRVPEPAGTETELDPPAGQQVQARHRAGEHGRLTQRQVQHVAGQPHPLGARGDVADQRPAVQESGLVRVVLEGDQVVAESLAQLGQCHCGARRVVARRDERAELEWQTVVGHEGSLPCPPPCSGRGPWRRQGAVRRPSRPASRRPSRSGHPGR